MSNKSAIVTVKLSYEGADGEGINITPISVAAPYQAQNVGEIDIADTTPSATAFDVPFGSVDDAATLVLVENKTSQDLGVKINGAAAASHRIAPGGFMCFGEVVAPGTAPITSIQVITTATVTEDCSVAYRVFGDPS